MNNLVDKIKQYTGLIFDMDGTLIDTMPAHSIAWEKTANHFNYPFIKDWQYSLGGTPGIKIVEIINQKFNVSLDPQEVYAYKTKMMQEGNTEHALIPCTYEILAHFHGHKKLAVGTGSSRETALSLLEKTCVLSLLDTVVAADDIDSHKPNPDTFLLAAKRMKVPAEQCVVFEDTALGMQAAHNAGMDCFMVENYQLTFYPCAR